MARILACRREARALTALGERGRMSHGLNLSHAILTWESGCLTVCGNPCVQVVACQIMPRCQQMAFSTLPVYQATKWQN